MFVDGLNVQVEFVIGPNQRNDVAVDPETRNPPCKAGWCPGKAGEYRRCANPDTPRKLDPTQAPFLGRGGFLPEIVRAPSGGLSSNPKESACLLSIYRRNN